MLKRLELVGFKSFADKTRFDFHTGITAIVGPNGSGKSNIVDAVKWILGEQSAKSLRGGEMADVIFNGSATRKSLGMAEVTMTFDNGKRVLNTDGEEVQITRRVYRDGTGEYLINGQISRLKDIKDLFLGSGAGSATYCIIEQGRVDALLQASTGDRRAIFEEAAGISRFKAKKNETLRKLEHVDQNLEQLRLIIGEVEKQHRKASMEANKAKKYLEYTERLKYLRLGMGNRDYRQLSETIRAENQEVEILRSGLTATQVQASEWEAEAYRLEQQLREADLQFEELQNTLSTSRQQIATFDSTLQHEWTKITSLEEDLSRTRQSKNDLSFHLRLMQQSVEDASTLVIEVGKQAQEQQDRVQSLGNEIDSIDDLVRELQEEVQSDRVEQFDLVRQASSLQSQAESSKQQLDRMNREKDSRRRRMEEKKVELESLDRVLTNLTQADADLQQRLGALRESLDERIKDRDMLRRLGEHLQQELAEFHVKRSDLRGRIEILETLERTQEGLSTGVREVVAILQEESLPKPEKSRNRPLSSIVYGLVVDLLTVPRELAPLIDLALGETSQQFVVRNSEKLDAILQARDSTLSGRVSFFPYVPQEPLAEGDETVTADRWVTCDHAELSGLPRQLLGNVRIVPDLATARQLANDPECSQSRFVTQQGELLEPDGTLTVGPARIEGGILSRKSELRDLRIQAESLEKEISSSETRLKDLRQRIESMASPIHGLEEEIRLMTSQVGDLQTQKMQHQQTRSRYEEEIALTDSELQLLDQEIASLQADWKQIQQLAEQAEQSAQALKRKLEESDRVIRVQEQHRLRIQQEHTSAKVALAHIEERLTGLQTKHQQLENDLRRGEEEYLRVERHQQIKDSQIRESQLTMLMTSASLATMYANKEQAESQLGEVSITRESLRENRRQLLDQLQAVRSTSKDQLEQLHARELALRDVQNRCEVLVNRIQEEYQIDLTTSLIEASSFGNQQPTYDFLQAELDVAAIQQEIGELQKRMTNLGRNVNLDSIQELEEVEAREKELKTQLNDLTSSQNALLEIINKINTDSRKLFTQTYEQIRSHFQDLFRKLFGGGQADVILENPEDVLESGIEILARPPGKELRSISLMSGGEKTLTAVALLLAIFQSKPSPFCLLDEVDAALDAENTTRLAMLLKEFSKTSQFIIITHKQPTMRVADVLSGITMQESGISKMVSVRLEDWAEEKPRLSA